MGPMAEPKLIILGVYKPLISQEIWQDQWNVTGSDDETHDHFKSLVLIEAVSEGLTAVNMGEFGQMQSEFPDDRSRMQVGYDEALLSADGESIIQREMDCVQGSGSLRFAVYLHRYDPARPLLWQGGEVTCPGVQDVPLRLSILMPYCVI